MAISRLQASLAQATNELTVAAANINFDFTLVKCEAPKEYLSLGNALSKKRKDEAEIGQLHITARRLGALFEGTCPATPNLIKAYGLRASEIAAHAKEHFAEPSGSIFAEQNGIDGTSIWAAATSSPAALHVQLLACMLARVWEVQQATSVWYELVKDRRKEVAKRYEEGENLRFATLTAAAQASITRSNLAEWDASARAWLRTADRVKNRAQQQLKLIVANMNIPVSSDMAVYSSVMAAWKSALESMEKLVSGMPQATNIGPPLLALSSWHLYPDLLAMGKREVSVRFDDPLVSPGGQLTIGLSTEDGEGRGVYWSLSLAHLNFYGSPVLSHGQFNVSSERLSFSQFAVAIFGSVMGAWHLRGRSINEVAELFIELDNFLAKANQDSSQGEKARDAVRRFFQNQSHWFRIMSNTAKLVLESSGAERDEVHKLIILGLRRSSELMPKDQAEPPFFGLCNSSELLGLMRGSVERVAFLRSIVEQCYSDNPTAAASLVIRIKGRSDTQAQYLTAVPLHQTPPHHRWLSDRGQQVQGESWSLIENLHKDDGYHWFTDASTGNQQTVREIYGDSDTATICQYRTTPRHSIPPPTLQTLIWSLRNNQLDALSLLRHLHYNVNVLYPLSATMFALSAAFTFYQSIPSATLNIKALNRPLFTAAWVPLEKRLTSSDPFESIRVESIKMARCRAFSCIAYMEACIDIPPSSLESVFALAHEDSLYLAMPVSLRSSNSQIL